MKILTIGDLHGKNCWQKIDIDHFDKIIFIGDYIDGPSDENDIKNLNALIDFKIANPNKIHLLLGNHDLQYYWDLSTRLKKYKKQIAFELFELFRNHVKQFEICYQMNHFLWTHAGITSNWMRFLNKKNEKNPILTSDYYSLLSHLFYNNRFDLLNTIGRAKGGYETGGPIRADISEIKNFYVEEIFQFVGHNKVPKVQGIGNINSGVLFCDCLNTRFEFPVLDTDTNQISTIQII